MGARAHTCNDTHSRSYSPVTLTFNSELFHDCDKVLLLLANSTLWVRKQRKAKEGRNTLDPVFWVKDNNAFDEEQIYEDLDSGESDQLSVADKSLFQEPRPENNDVPCASFDGVTHITQYDEPEKVLGNLESGDRTPSLLSPTRFLNLPNAKVCFKLYAVIVLKW